MNVLKSLLNAIKHIQNIKINDILIQFGNGININNIDIHEQQKIKNKTDQFISKEEKEQCEIDANIEHIMLIHSTRVRSNKINDEIKKHEIITLDSLIEVNNETQNTRLFYEIDNFHNLARDSVSFSGGGYNCIYHLGVVRYIFENPDLFKGTKYLGASGGAGIMGLVLCYENDPEKFTIIDNIIKDIIAMNELNLKLYEQVKKYSEIIETYINEDRFNKFIKGTNRCHISVTDVSSIFPKNIIKHNFEAYSIYMDTLKASACIPFILDDTLRILDNRYHLDGGLSNNMPILNKNTIKISCLNYPLMNADVYPKVICELKYSFTAPTKNYILNMHDLGYSNMEEFMKQYHIGIQLQRQDNELNEYITHIINDPDFVK